MWDGSIGRAGIPHLLGVEELPRITELLSLGLIILCVIAEGRLVATFGLQDQLRPDALVTVNELKRHSIIISIY
jgi:Cu2+-exporting ATPase